MIIFDWWNPHPNKSAKFYQSFHHPVLKTSALPVQEYRLICEGLGRTVEQAIDAQSFLRLVNEDEQGMTGLNHPVK